MADHPYREGGRLIKQYRRKARLTQRGLAHEVKIPMRTIQMYEQGRCQPSAPRLLAIMKRLAIPEIHVLTAVFTDNHQEREVAQK